LSSVAIGVAVIFAGLVSRGHGPASNDAGALMHVDSVRT
jgi:hypothetical protein